MTLIELFSARLPVKVFKTLNDRQCYILNKFHKIDKSQLILIIICRNNPAKPNYPTVSHSCLLNKLPSYGIINKELHWFTDYLFSLTQSLQFKGAVSDANPIFSGVPQGSILGLLLFTIHFNDAHTIFSQPQSSPMRL